MHLYIHVPFCTRRCSYCDFAIAVRRRVPSAEFAGAVLREWDRRRSAAPWIEAGPLATIYFGGGTPSQLDPGELERILQRVGSDHPVLPGAEITLEANPDDITTARARLWRQAGITRVSLGVQSFDPAVLDWMHRTHTADQVPAAVEALRSAGIDALSLDLIFGLPASLQRSWSRDLDRALALDPGHLSVYGLTVEPATPLARWVERGAVVPVEGSRYAAEFLEADRRLGAAGYRHYEVSNYARPGAVARHNSAYWRRAAYLGLGPSAHSGAGHRRWWNLRDWAAYQRTLAGDQDPMEGTEELGADAVRIEELYLGLRTDRGVPIGQVPPEVGARWAEQGWADRTDGMLRLTADGWLRLDALVREAIG